MTTYLEISSIISIHALLAESDANWFDLWGWVEYFYPRSPCGERRLSIAFKVIICLFLSTLSLRRATVTYKLYNSLCQNFYPRSPCGERLNIRQIQKIENDISIHALLAESDQATNGFAHAPPKFLSTLSLRRATAPPYNLMIQHKFLSTLSLRRATTNQTNTKPNKEISIHALLAESDCV